MTTSQVRSDCPVATSCRSIRESAPVPIRRFLFVGKCEVESGAAKRQVQEDAAAALQLGDCPASSFRCGDSTGSRVSHFAKAADHSRQEIDRSIVSAATVARRLAPASRCRSPPGSRSPRVALPGRREPPPRSLRPWDRGALAIDSKQARPGEGIRDPASTPTRRGLLPSPKVDRPQGRRARTRTSRSCSSSTTRGAATLKCAAAAESIAADRISTSGESSFASSK